MGEKQLLFRFTHSGTQYNLSTASFMFADGGDIKTAYGVIDGGKPLSLLKEMGVFVWGNQSEYGFSALWIMNEIQNINDTAGKYDVLLDLPRDTAVELFVCDIDGNGESDASAWNKRGEYHVDAVRNEGDDYIVISLQSKLVLMDKNTEHKYYSSSLVYVDNREQPRPICLGVTFNVPAKLVNDLTDEWEFHDESAAANVIAAYDDYDQWVEGTDFTEGTISSTGGYGINLTNPAFGKVTAFFSGAIYLSNPSNLAATYYPKLLTAYSSIDILNINTSSLSAIDSYWDGRYGVYIEQPTNVREIIEKTNLAHCGYTYINNDGNIAFSWLKEPAVTADYDINKYYIDGGVNKIPDGAVGLSDGVAVEKNWHVFTEGDVASGVSQSDKDKVTREFQSYYRSPTTTGGGDAYDDYYAHARNGEYIKTYGANANKITQLITHLEELYATKRHNYEFVINVSDLLTAMTMNIGETIEVIYPRWGLEAGKNLIIKKIEYNDLLNRKIKITGWG